MKEKQTINFFVAGNLADLAITYTALTRLSGFTEIGKVGSQLINQDDVRLIIAKIAVTAFLSGFYAISRNKNQRVEFVGRRSMEVSLAVLYLILASNAFQVAPEVLRQLSGR